VVDWRSAWAQVRRWVKDEVLTIPGMQPPAFQRGQKVVCVDASAPDPEAQRVLTHWPVEGQVYTVAESTADGVHLVELPNPKFTWDAGGTDWAIRASRFRAWP